ncbi:ribonuclease E/G [Halobacillus litoralis]|uniref:ribonuclease E/G n=1 Tax=Halobacillus litoralis TaxID=45668 RepID=UPI001CD1D076|nr:ribonuclease E/G [Halobacillus litoralis]MCA0969942.1 ribonuclease E/G [Halobacillus litoralis]
MRTITLHTKFTEKTGVVTEEGRVSEIVFDRPGQSVQTGSIYMGKVMKVVANLQAAFIDIGEEKHAFLRKEAVPWAEDRIEKALKEGESLPVQVIKEPFDDKGAGVSADLTIAGLYSVYQPFGTTLSVSKKLSPEQSQRLKDSLQEVLGSKEGAIIRTAASHVTEQQVLEEIEALRAFWQNTQAVKPAQKMVEDPLIPDQLLRKFPIHTVDEILVDDVKAANHLRQRFPGASEKIKWQSTGEERSINEWQQVLTNRTVELEDGIELVIDRTEAMTVIDVNSSKYQGRTMTNSHAFDVNKRAAAAIQRELRLRNLSGIILVDFISMKDKSLEQKLVQFMKKQGSQDPVKTNVYGMTKLGLMELTRKRDRVNAIDLFTAASSRTFTLETSVYRLERELMDAARSSSEAILLAVHPKLVNEKKRLLSSPISSKIPQELFVRQDVLVSGYQIELEGSENMVKEAIEHRGYHVDNLF